MKKIFFTRERIKIYNAYLEELIDQGIACNKLVIGQIKEYKKHKRPKFRIFETALSLREMLLVAGHFLENRVENAVSIWTDMQDEKNREYLRGKLENAEKFLEQIPGAVIPKRPVELEPLFKKGR